MRVEQQMESLLLIQRHSVTPPEHLSQQKSFTVDPTTQCHTPQNTWVNKILHCWSNDTVSHPQNTWVNRNLLLLIQRHSVTPAEHLSQHQSFTVDPTTQCHTPRTPESTKSYTVDPTTQCHTPWTPESTEISYCWSNDTVSHPLNTWVSINLLLLIQRHSVTPPEHLSQQNLTLLIQRHSVTPPEHLTQQQHHCQKLKFRHSLHYCN